MDEREVRGYSIVSKGNPPQLVNEETFLVPSQSSDKRYKVTLQNTWVCECPDFQFRKVKCKHIFAVEFLLKMRDKLNQDSSLDFAEELTTVDKCQFCSSENIVKNGSIKNKDESKQRFLCRDCNRTFYSESHLNYLKDPKIITLAFDLYFKGLSLRKITDTLNQFYGVKLHHETVRRWLMKFTEKMNEYTEQFKPETSDTWHIDEQMIKVNGKFEWSWNCLDDKTRFLIANNLTKKRNIDDACSILKEAKDTTDTRPRTIITDKLPSYRKAIHKEFPAWWTKENRVKHIKVKSKSRANNLVERYHSTFRERDKTMRGFKTENNIMTTGFKTYYNFIRKHQGLDGLTPSQKAGIELNLGRNRWLSLLQKSLSK